jgi:natural product biosynthesis luciferase-like monooxygenase protein
MRFSVMFFSAPPTARGDHTYEVFTRAVQWADQHELDGVWVPERHFTQFGGLFPNPVIALSHAAALTKNLKLRAGSVILPLHNPVRVAEDWAMVDVLSGGRTEISFGSGWNADDFALSPGHYEDRREYMSAQIEIVRRAWRGEPVELTNGTGRPVQLVTLPRPLQSELPIWLTAQSDSTFELAGRQGFPVLTNLNFTAPGQLSQRVSAYRRASREAGHGDGWVALMAHTFVGTSGEMGRHQIHEALTRYLGANLSMRAQASAARGVRLDASQGRRQAVAEDGAQRLSHGGSLVCGPEEVRERVESFRSMGVDELALLIDFVDDPDAVLAGLSTLFDAL